MRERGLAGRQILESFFDLRVGTHNHTGDAPTRRPEGQLAHRRWLEKFTVRAETHQDKAGRCVGFRVDEKQIRTQVTLPEAGHTAGKGMIFEFRIEILIGRQCAQYSG